MTNSAAKKVQVAAHWPRSVHSFGIELRRIAPQLRMHGVSVSFERRSGQRFVTLESDGTAVTMTSDDMPL